MINIVNRDSKNNKLIEFQIMRAKIQMLPSVSTMAGKMNLAEPAHAKKPSAGHHRDPCKFHFG